MHLALDSPVPDLLSSLEMKPRLRDDVCFAPSPGGAFVIMPSRPDMGFTVRGRHAYDWLRRLTPFLNGEHTIRDLGRRLDEDRLTRMRSLIAQLAREGALRDSTADRAHTLSLELRRKYARTIAFIGCSADSPEYRFQRFRESAPIVAGAGRLLPALVHGLVAAGVARVRVVQTGEHPTDWSRMNQVLPATVAGAGERAVEMVSEDCLRHLSSSAAGGVLHVSENGSAASHADALRAACGGGRLIFGQATASGRRGLVGPVVDPEYASPPEHVPPFEAILRERARDDSSPPTQDHLCGPTPALVSNHLCAAFLMAMTGLPNPLANRIVELDLETLQTTTHPVQEPSHPDRGQSN